MFQSSWAAADLSLTCSLVPGMDLYPLTDETKAKVEELRALIADAVAKNDEDSKLLTAEENVLQLQEGWECSCGPLVMC